MSITLTDHQFTEVKKIAKWFKEVQFSNDPGFFWLAGGGGVGKTSVVPAIIEQCGLKPDEVAALGPTGKSSKVLTGKFKALGLGVTAKTIHSMIYRPKSLKADVLQYKLEDLTKAVRAASDHKAPDVFYEGKRYQLKDAQKMLKQLNRDLESAYTSGDSPNWQLNTESDIREASLVIIDECSMCDIQMAEDLMSFGRPILAIGDPGQLPPIASKWGFCVGTPGAHLTEIHRQAKENPIIMLAAKIRNGESISVGNWGDTVKIVKRKDDVDTLNVDEDWMVLCGTNKKRWNLTQKIRAAAGYDLVGPMEGEPLMIKRNSKVVPSLVNGSYVICDKDYELIEGATTFTLTSTDEDGVKRQLTAVQALFEEHYFKKAGACSGDVREVYNAKKKHHLVDWGHVSTTHNAQGSQWNNVVVHDESSVFREDASRWLYTAVTRAAEKLTVVI